MSDDENKGITGGIPPKKPENKPTPGLIGNLTEKPKDEPIASITGITPKKPD
jgi:hypothetical protein